MRQYFSNWTKFRVSNWRAWKGGLWKKLAINPATGSTHVRDRLMVFSDLPDRLCHNLFDKSKMIFLLIEKNTRPKKNISNGTLFQAAGGRSGKSGRRWIFLFFILGVFGVSVLISRKVFFSASFSDSVLLPLFSFAISLISSVIIRLLHRSINIKFLKRTAAYMNYQF